MFQIQWLIPFSSVKICMSGIPRTKIEGNLVARKVPHHEKLLKKSHIPKDDPFGTL